MIKKIIVNYWSGESLRITKKVGIKHLEEFKHSPKVLSKIVLKVIEEGFNVQVLSFQDRLIVYIDSGKFYKGEP